jgi:electron transfer flavoprotein beta subunit
VKALVAVKQVPDPNIRPRFRAGGVGLDLSSAKMAMNPFDEIAVEAAVRLREQNKVSEVVLVSIGSPAVSETLRAGLAMGADRAILVRADDDLEPLSVAKVLKALVARESSDLVLLGKQAVDDDCNQTGQMLAGQLNWAQATFVSALDLEDGTVLTTRETDAGLETIRLKLPAVVTVDLRLNEPRRASLPNVMKARKKELLEVHLAQLPGDFAPRLKIVRVSQPKQRSPGVIVATVDELLDRLRKEARVI